jgi:hypothetical protein
VGGGWGITLSDGVYLTHTWTALQCNLLTALDWGVSSVSTCRLCGDLSAAGTPSSHSSSTTRIQSAYMSCSV